MLEALFALCRKAVENEPLKIFLALSDMDRRRETPLEPATVNRLAREWRLYASQYAVLNETGALTDKTVIQYLDTAAGIAQMRDAGLRADAAGTMQALVGLWQIFVRQESIRAGDADAALSGILSGFAKIRNPRELFDAGHAGVAVLLKTTGSPAGASGQDRLMDLLSGADQTGEEDDAHAGNPGHDAHLRGPAAGVAQDHLRPDRPPGKPLQGREAQYRNW